MADMTIPLCVRFSGGRSSAMMLHGLLQRGEFDPSRDVCVFSNTGEEMAATLDFVQECATRWGVPVVWLEYRLKNRGQVLEAEAQLQAYEGEVGSERYRALWNCRAGPVVAPPPWVVELQRLAMGKPGWVETDYDSASRRGEPFRDMVLAGNCAIGGFSTKRMCTANLKIYPTEKYLAARRLEDSVRVVGFRWDEPHRVGRAKGRGDEFRAPLHEWKVGREEVVAFWKRMPFDLRLPAVNGQSMHGNCTLCFLKGRRKIAKLMSECPERSRRWIALEDLMARRRNRFRCRMWLTRFDERGEVNPNSGWSVRPGGDPKKDEDWVHDGRIYRPTFLQGTTYADILTAAESGAWKKWPGADNKRRTFWADIDAPPPPCECAD